jgi:hypothetical protein
MEERNAYMTLVGKAEGKRPLRRPRHRWVDIRMNLRYKGGWILEWILDTIGWYSLD